MPILGKLKKQFSGALVLLPPPSQIGFCSSLWGRALPLGLGSGRLSCIYCPGWRLCFMWDGRLMGRSSLLSLLLSLIFSRLKYSADWLLAVSFASVGWCLISIWQYSWPLSLLMLFLPHYLLGPQLYSTQTQVHIWCWMFWDFFPHFFFFSSCLNLSTLIWPVFKFTAYFCLFLNPSKEIFNFWYCIFHFSHFPVIFIYSFSVCDENLCLVIHAVYLFHQFSS